MPPTGRRGSMLQQEGQYPKAMTYVGMAAAALGAIAGGFNLYEKNKDQFISGPPRSMPRMIEPLPGVLVAQMTMMMNTQQPRMPQVLVVVVAESFRPTIFASSKNITRKN